jgi:hypothetical protein
MEGSRWRSSKISEARQAADGLRAGNSLPIQQLRLSSSYVANDLQLLPPTCLGFETFKGHVPVKIRYDYPARMWVSTIRTLFGMSDALEALSLPPTIYLHSICSERTCRQTIY